MFFCLKPVLENPQLFVRARAGAGAKFQIFSGRGRARGPILKFFAGAGGRGGQISKFLRARAGAGAPKIFAGGSGRGPRPQGPARAPAGARAGFFFEIISEDRSNKESVCKKIIFDKSTI